MRVCISGLLIQACTRRISAFILNRGNREFQGVTGKKSSIAARATVAREKSLLTRLSTYSLVIKWSILHGIFTMGLLCTRKIFVVNRLCERVKFSKTSIGITAERSCQSRGISKSRKRDNCQLWVLAFSFERIWNSHNWRIILLEHRRYEKAAKPHELSVRKIKRAFSIIVSDVILSLDYFKTYVD